MLFPQPTTGEVGDRQPVAFASRGQSHIHIYYYFCCFILWTLKTCLVKPHRRVPNGDGDVLPHTAYQPRSSPAVALLHLPQWKRHSFVIALGFSSEPSDLRYIVFVMLVLKWRQALGLQFQDSRINLARDTRDGCHS